jgi:hypothetical protein
MCAEDSYLFHTYSIERVLLKKLTGSQLVKKFPTFYGNRMFITSFTSVRQLSLSHLKPVLAPQIQLVNVHLNIILPSIPGSSKWSLSLRFPHLCSPSYVLHAPPISFFPHHVLRHRFIEQRLCTTYTLSSHTC